MGYDASTESAPSTRTVDDAESIVARKQDHLELALSEAGVDRDGAGWEEVHLVPHAVPDLSLDDVDLGVDLLGHTLRAPLVIAGMTGGHPAAEAINARLGSAAERLGVAVGVGSQRAALRDHRLAVTYGAIRRHAHNVPVIANLGACQLLTQGGVAALEAEAIQQAIDMVQAQVLAIHFNVLEEAIQPEGDRNTSGLLEALADLVSWAPVPVMAKETGSGLTRETAGLLVEAGAAALDVGGRGGTSFARIEAARARAAGLHRRAQMSATFAEWGVRTPLAVLEARHAGVPVIATGGVRTGLDAAKALALGADLVGIGRVALEAARVGVDEVVERLEILVEELRLTLLLCDARTADDLRRTPPILSGVTASWARQRGLLA